MAESVSMPQNSSTWTFYKGRPFLKSPHLITFQSAVDLVEKLHSSLEVLADTMPTTFEEMSLSHWQNVSDLDVIGWLVY
jgi:hypothetical protein